MKIKNISKLPLEGFDGDVFVVIAPGETKEVPNVIVRRMRLIERGLAVVVGDEPVKPAAPIAQPVPAKPAEQPRRPRLDDVDA